MITKPGSLFLNIVLVVGIVFLGSGVLFFTRDKKALFGGLNGWFAARPSFAEKISVLKTQTNSGGDVTVEVTPEGVSSAGVGFTVKFTTHAVDLDFDLLREAVLKTDSEILQALSWDGGRGGHHLVGALKFPPLKNETKSLRLIITNVATVKERVFEWSLK